MYKNLTCKFQLDRLISTISALEHLVNSRLRLIKSSEKKKMCMYIRAIQMLFLQYEKRQNKKHDRHFFFVFMLSLRDHISTLLSALKSNNLQGSCKACHARVSILLWFLYLNFFEIKINEKLIFCWLLWLLFYCIWS